MSRGPGTPVRRLPHHGVLQVLLGGMLISFSGPFVKWAQVAPSVSAFYRSAFGAVALLVFVAVRRERLWRGWAPLSFATLAGLLFAADLFAWHRSILYVGPGLATILGNFQVFLLAAAGVLFLGERVSWRFVGSVVLAFIGLGLLVGLDWSSLEAGYRLGVALGLLTALLYASYLLVLRRAQRSGERLEGTANMMIISLVSAALLGASLVLEGQSLAVPGASSAAVLAVYGIVSQAIGWVLIANGLPHVRAAHAGLLLLVQPTLTFVWDLLFFRRPTTAVEGFGAVVALVAIYLGSTSFGRTAARPRQTAG